MARYVRQTVPDPGAEYDQTKAQKVAAALNRYMYQAQVQGETVAARYIMTDQPTGPEGLAVGTIYLKQLPGAPAGTYYLTVVTEEDPV
jgi:hypothetical protein